MTERKQEEQSDDYGSDSGPSSLCLDMYLTYFTESFTY